MTDNNTMPETAVDPVCGKTFDPRKVQFTSKDTNGTHYFCSDACRRRFDSADAKTQKRVLGEIYRSSEEDPLHADTSPSADDRRGE
jgi:YHS domain-containing protein